MSSHPGNDDRVWAFNSEGRLAPLKAPRRRGPRPTAANPFAWWMYKRHFTNEGLARAIECCQSTIARARSGNGIMRVFVMRLKRRWPDCPIKMRGTRWSARRRLAERVKSPLDKYLKMRETKRP